MNRGSPAGAAEQDSDEEGTGPDAPEAIALTYAKRTRAMTCVPAPNSRSLPFVSWLPPPASLCVRLAHVAFVSNTASVFARGCSHPSSTPPTGHAPYACFLGSA
ncbi:hypothetical protein DFH09DRAFT_1300275 [Mycena vulgaris]|nr:hypothetical protein DFH09DRAFT_1300275 [Mycena vulgaris]